MRFMPFARSPSWRSYRARLKAAFAGADGRVCLSFWLFGLVNNIFYVIILTAALDLVGPDIPKATVLLASIIPSLATKTFAPYVIHLVSYPSRIVLFALLSTCGMLVVALSPSNAEPGSVASKVAGIVLASLSSGAGEVHFLGLTHYYGHFSLAAWGSGTGGAGLAGAGAYALATTTLGFGVHATLLSSAVLSVIMLLAYFIILPLAPLRAARRRERESRRPATDEEDDDAETAVPPETAGLLDQSSGRPASPAYSARRNRLQSALVGFRLKLLRARALVVPYMVPLFLVYLAEYTINQGVAPTLLFPLKDSPFQHFRSFYPVYGTVYQLGVLISRSSLPFVRVRSLYIPSVLQVLNLVALTAHALWPFIPNVWFVFAVIFWEGLLGGLVYVSTFAAIREEVPEHDREFSLGAASVSDSGGILVAGLLGAVMESALCHWQVEHGRDWCKRL